MSIRDRLGRLTGEDRKPVQADPKQERLSELRRKIDEVMNRRGRLAPQSAPRPATGAVPWSAWYGEEVKAAGGVLLLAQRPYRYGHPRGIRARELAGACMDTRRSWQVPRPSAFYHADGLS
jgi:hypothetical protein